MKKTLAAVAVLSAFAGSALAADVTIYGRLDAALQYKNSEVTGFDGKKVVDDSAWGMESGGSTTSRLGIKGSEEISENLTVGFVLEQKLMADTGADSDSDRIFDRESVVYAKTNLGTLYAGRINSMWSDGGSTNFWAGNYVVFGTGTGGSIGAGTSLMVGHSRADNRISYVSPTFAGFTAYAEYDMGSDDAEENTRESDRGAALGLNYKNGVFGAGLVLTTVFEEDSLGKKVNAAGDGWTDAKAYGDDPEDQFTVNLGMSYDFGVAKVMVAGQYFKDANSVGLFTDDEIWGYDNNFDQLEGYGFALGADIPLAGGTLTVGGSYTDGEDKGDGATLYGEVKDGVGDSYTCKNMEFSGYNVAAQYKYPLSKRTRLYGTVGYTKLEWDYQDAVDKAEYESFGANVGIAHYF